MADLTIREYSVSFILLITAASAMITFSGSMWKTYDANVTSKTLQEIKKNAEGVSPNVGKYSNRTRKEIDIQQSSFLSPDAFGIIQSVIGSANNLAKIAEPVQKELGIPGFLIKALVAIPLVGLIWQGISALFGYNV